MTEGAAEDTVLRELRDDGVLVLTLNRPGRHNAWELDMEERYFGLLDDATADPDVRVIVLTGAGGTFCPGMDISRLTRSTTDPTYVRPVRRPQTYALGVPKPIVAAVDGACAGIGFVQAVMCDLRFTTARSKWTTSFVRRALTVEDAVSWVLPRLVGTGRAADLILSARVIRGDEAARIGLANEVVEPEDLLPTALAWASDVARSCSPTSLAVAKQQLLADLHGGLEASRLRANAALDAARDRPDYREGVAAFTEKRSPQFAGLDPAFGRLDVPGATPDDRPI